jgi:hypothetical protein
VGFNSAWVAEVAEQIGAPPPVLRPSEGLHDKTILNSALLLSDEIDIQGWVVIY